MHRWDFAQCQDDVNPHILHMLEGTFLFDVAQIILNIKLSLKWKEGMASKPSVSCPYAYASHGFLNDPF